MARVGIGLGSNLGDRQAELDGAFVFLRSLSVRKDLRESPRMETQPVDCPPGSPSFLNAVAEIEVDSDDLPPHELLRQLQSYEQRRGRPAERKTNAPRALDLDILYYDWLTVREPNLEIPHPRAHLRRFVLEPLASLRPDLIFPGQTRSIAELLLELRKTDETNGM